MADVEGALPLEARRELRVAIAQTSDPLVEALPKVELHVHIEGTLTPALKWKLAQRNGLTLTHPRTGAVFTALEELQASHDSFKSLLAGSQQQQQRMSNAEETLSFFDAYYGGFAVLKTVQDYHDLAMHYFERAASMKVRYCEVFFDPQGHTRTGVAWRTMMDGFRSAQEMAERDLNLKSAWIMCFLRDEPVQSALDHYLAALDYRDMIVGVGLDSNEDQRPPMLFEEVFDRARKDGFRLTAHCDVGKAYPVEHVRQVALSIGKSGADRIDHGLNAADSAELVESIRSRQLCMTICPWSYIRHQPMDQVFQRIRKLFDAGIAIAIASDDPAFMEDTWILENLLVVRKFCHFTDDDMVKLAQYAVSSCWASNAVKQEITAEIQAVRARHKAL